MLVKSVRLGNIRSYLSEEISFPEGSLLLSGDIGAGKSTILLAIEFALFGVVRGSVDGSSLLRHGKNSGYVELSFTIDSRHVLIRRSLRRNKSGVTQSAGYIVVDGIRTDCTPVEIKARVLDMLGYPKTLLTKSKSLIYRYTVYTPQEEMKHILFEDASARLDTLRRVFRIDRYKAARDNSSIISRSLKERIAEYSARVEDLPAKRKQLDDLTRQFREASSRLGSLLPLIRRNQEQLFSQHQLVRKYEEDVKKLNSLKSQLAALESSLSEKNGLLASTESEISSAAKAISEGEKALSDSRDSAEFARNLALLRSHVSSLKTEASSRQELQSELDSLQESLSSVASDIVRAETSLSESKKLEDNVLRSESCPVCLQPISERHKSRFRSKFVSERSAAESAIAAKSKEREFLNAKITGAKKNLDSAAEKERKLAELSAVLSYYSSIASELGIPVPDASGSFNVQDVLRNLSSLSSFLRGRARVRASVDEKKSYLESLRKRLSSTSSEVAELKKKISEARQHLASYSSLESDFLTVKSRLEKLQQEEKELLVRKASVDKEIENLDGSIKTLQHEMARKEADKKLLEKSVQLRDWVDGHFVNVAEVIEKHVMLRIYNEFNDLFRNWFNILMEDENISARLNDSFTPIVEVNGYEMPLENLSGGEKTSCALAYRLALNKVINDVITTIKTRDVLILDEPTDGFSSQQLEKVRDVLEQLQLPQIILVSHESKIESFVENVIRVVKEQHVSHIISST